MAENWIDVGPATDFPHGCKKNLRLEGTPLTVCNIDGKPHAIANVCPHAGLPLGEGELRGKIITCPFHGYAYNVVTGQNIDFPDQEPPIRTFPVRTSDTGVVQVDLSGANHEGIRP